jgi:hypothetical protein
VPLFAPLGLFLAVREDPTTRLSAVPPCRETGGASLVLSSGSTSKDGDEWETSTIFGRDELPLVAKIADMVHTWIYQQGQESNGEAY